MPAKSERQRRLFGAAYGAKKAGRPCPSYVPRSICRLPLKELRKWAKKVRKRKKRRK